MEEKMNEEDHDNKYSQLLSHSREYKKVMKHVNKDYHMAFKEWLVN